MNTATKLFLTGALGLGLVACGLQPNDPGTTADAGNPPPAGKSASEFCTALNQATVDAAAQCYGGPPDLWRSFLFRGKDPCEDIDKSIASGRLTYDAAEAEACLTALGSATCTDIYARLNPAVCDKVLAGTVPKGGACYDTADCAGDAFCTADSRTCPGVCKARVPADGTCAADDLCVSGHECVSGVCTPVSTSNLGAVGAACGGGTAGCKPSLACDARTGTCVPVVREGQACSFGGSTCELFTYCAEVRNTCTRWGSAGQECGVIMVGTEYEYAGCAAGAWCDTAAGEQRGKCAVAKDPGRACTSSEECKTGLCVGGTCATTCSAP
ncbi:MAG: Dickkopf N-terminal cysteine-rich domain-containing protein [Myxococcaceae bacterium]